MSGFRTAWTFLTRIPIGDDPRPELARGLPWFPVVGALIGAIAAGAWAAARELVGPLPAAVLAIVAVALLTGAFHQDGLADMADGFGGGWNAEQRITIMKDSRHGTYGVMALVSLVLVQVSALAAHGQAQGAAALVAAHVIGRAAAIGLTVTVPPASAAGLGSGVVAGASRGAVAAGAVVGLAIATALVGTSALVAGGVAALFVALCALLAVRKIGGITGDVLGAAEQLAECAVLLCTAAFVHHGAGTPWLLH